MPIIVNLDVMMAKRHMGAGELAETIGITPANLSILKNNKAKAVRFSTLEALCKALDCQPADLLEYRPVAKMLDKTSSIICAFGLASAAPRSPYRHLELCGVALDIRRQPNEI